MLSVIVPTFNRASSCVLAAQSVLAQDTRVPHEVIIVDNNSTDDTRQRIQALRRQAPQRLRYVFEGKQGLSAARNAGIATARGNIIAWLDDDALARPGWLDALAETYRTHPDAWCVGGKIVLALPEVLPRWFNHSFLLTSQLGLLDLGDATIERRYPDFVFGGNFSVRRDALDRVGPFDTRLGLAGAWRVESEEADLCWRIQQTGGAVYYCGRAIVAHVVPAARITKRYFRRRAYWAGRTWRLLHRTDIWDLRPRDLARAALRVVRGMIESWVSPRRVDRRRGFENELKLWQCAGYQYQAFLARIGHAPHRGRTPHRPG